MFSEFLTLGLAFLEGLGLILSPCILPILPIVLAGSLAGSKKRPFGFILGFTFCFALFAFFSRTLVLSVPLDSNFLRYLAYGLLFLLGLVLFFEGMSKHFSSITASFVRFSTPSFLRKTKDETLVSGFILGGLIALVWTPCAGPILATVIIQTIQQKTNLMSFLTLLAFALGTAIPMGLIALYGIKLMERLSYFKKNSRLAQKILGLIIMFSIGYFVYEEQHFSLSSKTPETPIRTWGSLKNGLWRPYKAPEIAKTDLWFNTRPLKLAELKGQVVLIDFWTYSCINCIRTLPYLKAWYKKYHSLGFTLIGVHTPEFAFEKNKENVQKAVRGFELTYPVVLDNEFQTWLNYNNHYWPAHYLINKEGYVVYTHFGEGNYEITENNIRFLLGLNEQLKSEKKETGYSFQQTKETYLGFDRADKALAPSLVPNKITDYQFPKNLKSNAWALEGKWLAQAEKIIAFSSNASIKLHFNARKIFIVMNSSNQKPLTLHVFLNNKKMKSLPVEKAKLYEVLTLDHFQSGIVTIIAEEPGLELYTFTFES